MCMCFLFYLSSSHVHACAECDYICSCIQPYAACSCNLQPVDLGLSAGTLDGPACVISAAFLSDSRRATASLNSLGIAAALSELQTRRDSVSSGGASAPPGGRRRICVRTCLQTKVITGRLLFISDFISAEQEEDKSAVSRTLPQGLNGL